MKKLLYKELKLCASPLSYFFLLGAFMVFVPGYPILMGAFFTTLGIFYSFQTIRDNNDIEYSLLLPTAKTDIVRGKYLFVLLIEGCSFVIMTAITLIRMLCFCDAGVYVSNALMCANFTFLGFALLIFGLFNFIFVSGFFKTAYYFGKPFLIYCVVSLVVIFVAEALRHFPGLDVLNAFGLSPFLPQGAVFAAGVVAFAALTFLGLKRSARFFEATDL